VAYFFGTSLTGIVGIVMNFLTTENDDIINHVGADLRKFVEDAAATMPNRPCNLDWTFQSRDTFHVSQACLVNWFGAVK